MLWSCNKDSLVQPGGRGKSKRDWRQVGRDEDVLGGVGGTGVGGRSCGIG